MKHIQVGQYDWIGKMYIKVEAERVHVDATWVNH